VEYCGIGQNYADDDGLQSLWEFLNRRTCLSSVINPSLLVAVLLAEEVEPRQGKADGGQELERSSKMQLLMAGLTLWVCVKTIEGI
jgi:hypothetical protein